MPVDRAKIEEVRSRLIRATISSCKCMVKTPVPSYHDDTCPYRALTDAIDLITDLEVEQVRATE